MVGQVCLQVDGHGDVGFTATGGGGGSSPGLGLGGGIQGSNADRIKDLDGWFCTAGFSVSDGEYFGGADAAWGVGSKGRPVYVGELSGGVGPAGLPLPVEVHAGATYTGSASVSIPKIWHWLTNLGN